MSAVGSTDDPITVTKIARTGCQWMFADKYGNSYLHGIAAYWRVSGAGWFYDGDYCRRHARLAAEWSRTGIVVNL
jgi:hypothetical protein